MPPLPEALEPAGVPVWDGIVRGTHWAVAALVFWEWWEDSGGPLHRYLGYVAAGLVLLRLVWGLLGRGHARFDAWAPSPARLSRYVRAALAGHPPRHLGHNPLGALMIFALWAAILALAVTGWMSRLDAYWGEDWVIDLHRWVSNALMVLVAVHVAAAVVMSWVHRENLVAAMVSGRKRRG